MRQSSIIYTLIYKNIGDLWVYYITYIFIGGIYIKDQFLVITSNLYHEGNRMRSVS